MTESGRSILFLTPCFLQYRLHKQIRGVEVFDLLLVRQLVELGHEVTLIADRTWRERFALRLAGAMPKVIYTPSLRKLWINAWLAERAVRSERFDALIVGNNARGLLPSVKRLLKRGCAPRATLIAHRPPRPDYITAARGLPMDVTAVNDEIASMFDGVTNGRVETRYGIPNAELYAPRTEPRDDAAPVRFVMLGRLDTKLKRVDRALAALERLPSEIRDRAELHLASYPDPPRELPAGVTAYPWMTPPEVAALLQRMDVFVALSDHETFCQAMVQSMLTGLPSVVNTVPTLVEKAESGAGIVTHDDDELVAAMERMVRDAALRKSMGETARRIALERYVWNTQQWLEDVVFPAQRASASTMSVAL